jgi:hypothetical protein
VGVGVARVGRRESGSKNRGPAARHRCFVVNQILKERNAKVAVGISESAAAKMAGCLEHLYMCKWRAGKQFKVPGSKFKVGDRDRAGGHR